MTAYAYEGEILAKEPGWADGSPSRISITSCKRCGAAVIEHEQTTHTDWHEEQETR
jgi:hypothetical protein